MFPMEDEVLTKTDADEICGWCFARDGEVLEHASSRTFWHEDCFKLAKDCYDRLPPKRTKTSDRR